MKQLILDRLKRQWLWWAFLACFNILIGFVLTEEHKDTGSWIIFVCFVSTNLLISKSGYTRALLALPFTARQIGQMLWLTYVGFGSLVFVVGSCVGMLLFSSLGKISWFAWGSYSITAFLSLGSTFWLCSGSPVSTDRTSRQKILGWIYGLFGLALIGLGWFLLNGLYENFTKLIAFIFLGGVMTLFGWGRAEGMVVDYGEARSTAQSSGCRPCQHTPPVGFGRMPFLVARLYLQTIALTVWTLGALCAYILFQKIVRGRIVSGEDLHGFFMVACFWVLAMSWMPATSVLAHLRFLRSLPVSSMCLAATLLTILCLPYWTIAGTFAAISAICSDTAESLGLLQLAALGMVPLCLLEIGWIWNRKKRIGVGIGLGLALVIAVAVVMRQFIATFEPDGSCSFPLWFIILYPAAVTCASWFFFKCLLERNTMAYHIRTEDLRQV